VVDFSYSTGSVAAVRADVVVLPVFAGAEPGPGVKEVGQQGAFAAAKLKGKPDEQLLVTNAEGVTAGAVLLVGVGERKGFDANRLRVAMAKAAPTLARFGTVATTFPQAVTGRGADEAFQAVAEGLVLGGYRFDRYRTQEPDLPTPIRKVTVLGGARTDAKSARAALERGRIVAEAVNWARDLVNTPAGDMSPAQIAREAQKMARSTGLTCKVWGEAELKKGGFGGILGVGAGSVNPPRLIELTYRGAGSATPIALTGKGIAFDSGGLSIKDSKNMESMKDDMGGAASILATMRVLAQLKPKVNVIAAIPSSENMPSGSATKPGDVLTHRGGKTSEVLNTDAEGRLVLADSLAYLAEKKPRVIIDTATLTGACMVALGEDITGAMGNDASLIRDLLAAGEAVGEPAWELPLWAGYKRQIESPIADVKNIGDRWGGAITAALFLAEFAGDVPWVHLDIAGPAYRDRPGDLGPRGATGVPVRTLVRYVLDHAAG
jgi:leucyl aminopeptidase